MTNDKRQSTNLRKYLTRKKTAASFNSCCSYIEVRTATRRHECCHGPWYKHTGQLYADPWTILEPINYLDCWFSLWNNCCKLGCKQCSSAYKDNRQEQWLLVHRPLKTKKDKRAQQSYSLSRAGHLMS